MEEASSIPRKIENHFVRFISKTHGDIPRNFPFLVCFIVPSTFSHSILDDSVLFLWYELSIITTYNGIPASVA